MRRRSDFRDPTVQLSFRYFFDFHEQFQSLLAARLRLGQHQRVATRARRLYSRRISGRTAADDDHFLFARLHGGLTP
jgi:hypothetical protein